MLKMCKPAAQQNSHSAHVEKPTLHTLNTKTIIFTTYNATHRSEVTWSSRGGPGGNSDLELLLQILSSGGGGGDNSAFANILTAAPFLSMLQDCSQYACFYFRSVLLNLLPATLGLSKLAAALSFWESDLLSHTPT